MRINNLKTEGFGKFTSKELLDFENINIFYGENESGKSTVFKMMTSLLFGFDKKKDALLINKENNILNIKGNITTNKGSLFIERDYEKEDCILADNKRVDGISGINVGRDIYSTLYSLHLDILLDINTDTWEDIEELLTRQYSGDIYNTPKKVMDQISEDLNKIKRSSNRGNSKLKSLEKERAEQKKEKRKALQSFEQIDELTGEIQTIKEEINRLLIDKNSLLNDIAFIEKYKPISDLYRKKTTLEKENYIDYIYITEEKYRLLMDKKREFYKSSEMLTAEVNAYISRKRELEKLLTDRLDERDLNQIIELDKKAETIVEEIKKVEPLLDSNRSKLKEYFSSTFNMEFSKDHLQELSDLDFNDVKARLKKIDDINEEIKIIDRNNRSIRGMDLKTKIVMLLFLLIGGGILFYLNKGMYYNYAAIAFIALSISGMIHAFIKDRGKIKTKDDLIEERDQLKEEFVVATDLKLNIMVKEYMDISLYDDLKTIKSLSDEYLYSDTIYNLRKSEMESIKRTFHAYFNEDYSYLERKIKLESLFNRMEEQKEAEKEMKALNRDIDRINDKLDIIDKNIDETEGQIDNIERVLLSLGESLEEGFQVIEAKKADKLRLDNINKDLLELSYLEEELTLYNEKYSSYNILDLKNNIEDIIEQINNKKMDISNLDKDISVLSESVNLDKIEGELAFIEEEIKTEKIKYDKLLLLRYLIYNKDEKYKELHQPKIYKKAGEYLYQMTGKYSELKILDDKNLLVKYHNEYIKVDSSFSKGTLNQIYLALRLSLIDVLDDDMLPICFDELLVNFDENRLNNTIEIINQIGENRQIFIFTCNKNFYDKLSGKKYLL